MVDGVRAAAQSEIDDIDAVYLSDVLVSFSPVDVFGDQFGNAEQHALEIGVLVVVLNLEENQGTFGVLGKDVDAVVLVELAFLVALAFEQPPDGDFLVEQGGQQPFQYGKVRFIPKEAFHRPVETDVIGHGFQCYIITKERINFELGKEERGESGLLFIFEKISVFFHPLEVFFVLYRCKTCVK